ncbi:hypothetical protein BZA70DRAFT_157913 [Myxozyma melibiosi]|uniref:Uncharacterized protein n=1 Tax=Myxozyma melibiosi TaxID=54550 RepID=A0ABR1F8L8_9ASCO
MAWYLQSCAKFTCSACSFAQPAPSHSPTVFFTNSFLVPVFYYIYISIHRASFGVSTGCFLAVFRLWVAVGGEKMLCVLLRFIRPSVSTIRLTHADNFTPHHLCICNILPDFASTICTGTGAYKSHLVVVLTVWYRAQQRLCDLAVTGELC